MRSSLSTRLVPSTHFQSPLDFLHLRIVRLQQLERSRLRRRFQCVRLLFRSSHQFFPSFVHLNENLRFLRQLNVRRGENLFEIQPTPLTGDPFVDRSSEKSQTFVPFIDLLSNRSDVARRFDRRHRQLRRRRRSEKNDDDRSTDSLDFLPVVEEFLRNR